MSEFVRKRKFALAALAAELEVSVKIQGTWVIIAYCATLASVLGIGTGISWPAPWIAVAVLALPLPAAVGWLAARRRLARMLSFPEYYAYRSVKRRLLGKLAGRLDRALAIRRDPARLARSAVRVGIDATSSDRVQQERGKDAVRIIGEGLTLMLWLFVFCVAWYGGQPLAKQAHGAGAVLALGSALDWGLFAAGDSIWWARIGRSRVATMWGVSPVVILRELGYEWHVILGWRRSTKGRGNAPMWRGASGKCGDRL